ncbi:MAG: hypothetical protein WC639_04770 [Patescibacteria group bacterium]|jgi:hypothetical protein
MTLPDEQSFRNGIEAVNKFQKLVHACMVPNHDYGVIPGTNKPTLLKPGAEKIAKLLGLADTYEVVEKIEDWNKPFFSYLIKCRLVSVRDGVVISEGLGECNSYESKYRYRWVGDRDLPPDADISKLARQERKSKSGGHWTVYRLDNEDIFSQVNTLLKMAKKRALVDASLSAGRLSDVFTQDIEDIGDRPVVVDDETPETTPEPKPTTKLCTIHNVEMREFNKEGRKWWSHKLDNGDWCNGAEIRAPRSKSKAQETESDVKVEEAKDTLWPKG